jgi:hypothetical protein
MADAVAGLQAAGFGAVTPAYRWSAAERDGEHWVVRFPRDGEGLGVCRIETRQMAETLAAMLIDALASVPPATIRRSGMGFAAG